MVKESGFDKDTIDAACIEKAMGCWGRKFMFCIHGGVRMCVVLVK